MTPSSSWPCSSSPQLRRTSCISAVNKAAPLSSLSGEPAPSPRDSKCTRLHDLCVAMSRLAFGLSGATKSDRSPSCFRATHVRNPSFVLMSCSNAVPSASRDKTSSIAAIGSTRPRLSRTRESTKNPEMRSAASRNPGISCESAAANAWRRQVFCVSSSREGAADCSVQRPSPWSRAQAARQLSRACSLVGASRASDSSAACGLPASRLHQAVMTVASARTGGSDEPSRAAACSRASA